MNDLSDENAPFGRRCAVYFNADGELLGIGVEIDRLGVGGWLSSKIGSDFGLEAPDLIPCSPAFQPDTIKFIHEIESLHNRGETNSADRQGCQEGLARVQRKDAKR